MKRIKEAAREIPVLGSHKKLDYPNTGSIMTSHLGKFSERLILSSYFFISLLVSLTPFS